MPGASRGLGSGRNAIFVGPTRAFSKYFFELPGLTIPHGGSRAAFFSNASVCAGTLRGNQDVGGPLSIADDLERLNDMRERGLLDDEELGRARQRLLAADTDAVVDEDVPQAGVQAPADERPSWARSKSVPAAGRRTWFIGGIVGAGLLLTVLALGTGSDTIELTYVTSMGGSGICTSSATAVVRGSEGQTVGKGEFHVGVREQGRCIVESSIDVDRSDFYTITLSGVPGEVTYSRQELEANGWEVGIEKR
jgi:hypothetical protein